MKRRTKAITVKYKYKIPYSSTKKGVPHRVPTRVLVERFKWKGRFARRREIYFNTKRNGARILELQKLANDVDYIIDMLHKLERRTRIPTLIATDLRNLQLKLFYLNNRKSYNSDKEMFEIMGRYYCLWDIVCRRVVLHANVETEWWLLETEGGKEQI